MPLFKRREQVLDLAQRRQECREFITWMVAGDDIDEDDIDEASEVRPAEHSRRFEALVLQLRAEDESAVDFARIERHDDPPPTLGAWEILEEG
jgi:hypothetical protein